MARLLAAVPFLCSAGLVAGLGLLACAEPNFTPYDDEPDLSLPDRAEPADTGSGPADAAIADTAPATDAADATAAGLRVFVTSTLQGANLGGLAGADALCQSVATGASLGGPWVAWLSTKDGPHAVDRLTSAGPWSLVSGEVVAANKAALVGGTLAHAIDHDEKGVLVTDGRVWTGSGADGRYLTNDCDAWNGGEEGRVGLPTAVDATWTSSEIDGCASLRRLYCFQK